MIMITKYRLQNILAKQDNIIIGASNRAFVNLIIQKTYVVLRFVMRLFLALSPLGMGCLDRDYPASWLYHIFCNESYAVRSNGLNARSKACL